MTLLLLLAACDRPTRADYERLEKRVEALEARAREEQAAARAAAAPPAVDDRESKARRMLAELQLIGRPAPPLVIDTWAQGRASLDPDDTALVVFFEPTHPDAAAGLAKVRDLARDRSGLELIGVGRGEGVEGWLHDNRIGFPVGLDRDGSVAEAWHRSAPVSAALVKKGTVVWTGTTAGFGEEVLDKHL